MLAGHALPHGLAHGVAEADGALLRGIGEEDAPAVVGHLDRAIGRPAAGVDRGRGAQIDVGSHEAVRAEPGPPFEEFRLPMLERALQRAVVRQVDVVRDPLAIIDVHQTRSQSKVGREPEPNSFRAPFSPTALGRLTCSDAFSNSIATRSDPSCRSRG